MAHDHRPQRLHLLLAALTLGFAFVADTAHAQTGPVVEVLDQGEGAQTPQRYDARGQQQPRLQPRPLTIDHPQPQPPLTTVSVPPTRLPAPMSDRERRRGNAYIAFGAQTGVFLGLGGGLALAIAGDRTRAGVTVGSIGVPLLGALLAGMLRRWARNDHWRDRPAHVMAGIYPGAVQGALFASSIAHAFDLEGQERNRTLGLAMGATALLSMVLHGNAGEAAPKRAGLYYATLAVTAIALLPFAHAYDKPEAMLYGVTAAGAAHLILTGMAPTLRW